VPPALPPARPRRDVVHPVHRDDVSVGCPPGGRSSHDAVNAPAVSSAGLKRHPRPRRERPCAAESTTIDEVESPVALAVDRPVRRECQAVSGAEGHPWSSTQLARRPYGSFVGSSTQPPAAHHRRPVSRHPRRSTAAGCCAPGLPTAMRHREPSTCAPCSLLPPESRGRSRRSLAVPVGTNTGVRRRPLPRPGVVGPLGTGQRGEEAATWQGSTTTRAPVGVSSGSLEVRPAVLPVDEPVHSGHSP